MYLPLIKSEKHSGCSYLFGFTILSLTVDLDFCWGLSTVEALALIVAKTVFALVKCELYSLITLLFLFPIGIMFPSLSAIERVRFFLAMSRRDLLILSYMLSALLKWSLPMTSSSGGTCLSVVL